MADDPTAEPILRRLLVAAGYELSASGGDLLAYRIQDRRAILLVPAGKSPGEAMRAFPAVALHRSLLYAEEPGAAARAAAGEAGVDLLAPETLGPALGELLLLPVVPPVPVPDSLAPLEPPVTVVPPEERIVRPRIARSEAEAVAGMKGFRSTLRLVPFYVAAYRVRSPLLNGRASPPHEELVAVNALTSAVSVWSTGQRELVHEVTEPHRRLEPVIGEAQAREVAEEALRRRHAVGRDHTEQHGSALVIERRRVMPGPDDLRLGSFVLLHVPFWYVEGAEGRVVVDAVTGSRSEPETLPPAPGELSDPPV
jgi:hypothetical protein